MQRPSNIDFGVGKISKTVRSSRTHTDLDLKTKQKQKQGYSGEGLSS